MIISNSSEPARATLRKEHGVRLVTREEEGSAAAVLPSGVYGFTSAPALASPLFTVRHYRNFEIHKMANGAPAVIGFVTAAEAAQLTRGSIEPVVVTLHPDAEGEATIIVAVSYDRIVQHRQYSVRNAASIILQVMPSGAALTI